MIIEKLVCYTESPTEVFERLQKAWQEQRFSIQALNQEKFEMVCKGFSYGRTRVDVSTHCIPIPDGTLVQMIYSPILTPVVSRPVSLSTTVNERVLEELDAKMDIVLNAAGSWEAVPDDLIETHAEHLQDPVMVQNNTRHEIAKLRMLIGLVVAVLGGVMTFLHVKDIFAIGSTNLWLTSAVLGVIIFSLGLFGLMWRK